MTAAKAELDASVKTWSSTVVAGRKARRGTETVGIAR